MTGRPRILIATPDRAECEVLAEWLVSDGFEPVRAASPRAAADEIQGRDFDLLLADFALAFRGGLHALSRGRARNPKTPTVVIASGDEVRTLGDRSDVLCVERPVEHSTLICMVSMVIMENRPVRRSPRKTVPRLDAVVDGIKSRILDVSNEGLRLEIPRDRRSASPPYFNVRVPLIGVALTVQRVWTSIPSDITRAQVGFCGAALIENPARASQAWRAFVDALPSGGGMGSRIVQVQ